MIRAIMETKIQDKQHNQIKQQKLKNTKKSHNSIT